MAKNHPTTQRANAKSRAISTAKALAGTVLMTVLPKRRQRMESLATIPWHAEQQPDAIDRLIRTSLLWWRARDTSGSQLAGLHQGFWRKQSAQCYYAGTQGRFNKVFLPYFDCFLDRAASEVHEQGLSCLVEIGCGDGQLLRHMQQHVPLARYVGLDLSEDQIAQNAAASGENGPEYFSGDAAQWITANAPINTLYVTGLGVLEYFTQAQLTALLQHISTELKPACALFIEPIDPDADLDQFDASYVAGEEHSFTHNYSKRLEEAGWTVILSEEVPLETYRWLVTIACVKA